MRSVRKGFQSGGNICIKFLKMNIKFTKQKREDSKIEKQNTLRYIDMKKSGWRSVSS